ncbi:MAG: winged helix DNA-binding domain-containing protein [Firmicutes bacterium]|nr:winged helix DNA-binding domain-containing protein [Bacillota bacterium]
MNNIQMTKEEARNYLVNYHMINSSQILKGDEGIKQVFDRIMSIQQDPLNVVGINADLVLQSRIRDYKASMLYEALYLNRFLIDAWDKQMCIYQLKDYSNFSTIRVRQGELQINTLEYRVQLDALKYVDEIIQLLKEKGPLYSSEITIGETTNHKWGNIKASSATLDYLFQAGKIGIKERRNTQKRYDLIEHLILNSCESYFTNIEEEQLYHVYRRILSMGLVWNKNGVHFSGEYVGNSKIRNRCLEILLQNNTLTKVVIEGIKEPFYLPTHALDFECNLEDKISFIAPLDNLIWDRNLIKVLFDFDYKWEVYTPIVKRVWGYYVLPILYKNKFIGRIEFEPQRKSDPLIIKNIWYEEKIVLNKKIEKALDKALLEFAKYLGAKEYKYQP